MTVQKPNLDNLHTALAKGLSGGIAEPLHAQIGNPSTGEVYVNAKQPQGLVWIFGLPTMPEGAVKARQGPGFGRADIKYGRHILVTRDVNGFIISGPNPDTDAEFMQGVAAEDDQKPIYIHQLFFGTLQPTSPPSMQAIFTRAFYMSDGTLYLVDDTLTADFSASPDDVLSNPIDLPVVNNQALAVLVQLDVTTGALSYKQTASTYNAAITLPQLFRNGDLPQPDDDREPIAYIKLIKGMSAITKAHILNVWPRGGGSIGTLTLADLPDGATAGQPLRAGGGGGDPSYGALNVSSANNVTSELRLNNGGTGTDMSAIAFDGQLTHVAGLGFFKVMRVNQTATTDPTVTDDTNSGYLRGSWWFNTTTGVVWDCFSSNVGAADWRPRVMVAATQTLTNKTLTAPTIADFTNANHDHLDADDGGTLSGSAIASGTVAAARLGLMTGDSGSGGASGAVPAPAPGDATKFLRGDGTFADPNGSVIRHICDGRLTLSSTNPYYTGSYATTLYFLPTNRGNQIAVYDGSAWELFDFSSVSITNSGLSADTNYDVFIHDSSGLALVLTAWTNATTRATALTTQDGVLVKSGTTTQRYLGTVRTIDNGGTVSFIHEAEALDYNARLYVWNLYNQRNQHFSVRDSSSTSGNNSGNWRIYLNAAATKNALHFVVGIVEEVDIYVHAAGLYDSNADGARGHVGIGLDGISANIAQINRAGGELAANDQNPCDAFYHANSHTLGYHYFQMMDKNIGGQANFIGDGGTTAENIQAGLRGHFRC